MLHRSIYLLRTIGKVTCCYLLDDRSGRPPPCLDSVYGLQHREKSIAELLSKLSLNGLGIAGQAEYMAEYMAEAAKEKVVVTGPLISAVLAPVMLKFLVGFNIGVVMYESVHGGRQPTKGHAVD